MSSAERPAGREYIHYFDPIRLMAAFGVIFMHTASGLLRRGPDMQWAILNICTSFAFTSVPLFLLMSGYLILSSGRTTDIPYHLTRRLPHVLIPLCFWTVVAVLAILFPQHLLTPTSFFDSLVRSFRDPAMLHLWYMYQLIALYLLAPVLCAALRGLDRAGHSYVLLLIGAVTLQTMLITALPDGLKRFVDFDVFHRLKIYSGNLCTFVLGYYAGGAKKTIPNRILAPLSVALLGVISAGSWVLMEQNVEYTESFVNQNAGFEVALAACIFLLWKQNYKKAPPPFLRPAAALTFPIYLMHGVLLTLVVNLGFGPQGFLGAVRVSVLIFLTCFLCMKTAASVKPFCFLITGIRYEDACRTCNWQYTLRTLRVKASQRTNPKGDR